MDGHALGEVVPSSLALALALALALPLPLPLLLPSPVTVRSIASLMENVGGGGGRSAECDLGGISTDSRRSFGVWFGLGIWSGKNETVEIFRWCSGWLARAPGLEVFFAACLFDIY